MFVMLVMFVVFVVFVMLMVLMLLLLLCCCGAVVPNLTNAPAVFPAAAGRSAQAPQQPVDERGATHTRSECIGVFYPSPFPLPIAVQRARVSAVQHLLRVSDSTDPPTTPMPTTAWPPPVVGASHPGGAARPAVQRRDGGRHGGVAGARGHGRGRAAPHHAQPRTTPRQTQPTCRCGRNGFLGAACPPPPSRLQANRASRCPFVTLQG